MKKLIPIFLILVLLLSGCKKDNNTPKTDSSEVSSVESLTSATKSQEANFSATDTDMFTDRDSKTQYSENDSITIKLNGTTATASDSSVKIEGSTITITKDKTHIISGALSDGMIIVNAPDTAKLQLVFNGVNITSKTSAALYILEADKVFVTLAEGTQNTLANGGSFTVIDDSNIDAALFSKQDLTINGNGSLTISSPAAHGIVCKDDLVITGGSYTVNSASHGIDANDSARIKDASITIDAGKDGIHAENTDDSSLGFVYLSSGKLDIEAEGDGISSGYYTQIKDGTINIIAGGGSQNGTKEASDFYGGFMGGRPGGHGGKDNFSSSNTTDESSTSMKGIKATNSILISGGKFNINSADDAIHSDISLTINGGVFDISSGDDALHAEEALNVTNGDINIAECYEGLEALNITVSGGDIKMVASDDGLNAAGGTDSSGTTGGRDGMFGGPGGHGGFGGGMSSNSNGSVVISGGKLYINSSGDGIDANGTLTISGGHTTVVGPTQGDTATLDYDKSATITGGTFIGTGASNMAQTFSSNKQGVIAISVGNQSANTQITIKDKNGKTIISYVPELSYQVAIISTPDIITGESYTLTVGTNSEQIQAN